MTARATCLVAMLVAGLPAVACTGAGGGAEQATPDTGVTELTALDYIEIQQLVSQYAWALDTCSNDGFDYADLYVADGVFISGDTGQRWEGREQLAEAAGGNGRGCPFTRMPLSHVIVNLVIEPTAEGAKGKSYLVYPGIDGQFVDADHSGHDGGYQDTYVKTAEGWRFKERIHVYPPQIPGQYTGTPNRELAASESDAG